MTSTAAVRVDRRGMKRREGVGMRIVVFLYRCRVEGRQ